MLLDYGVGLRNAWNVREDVYYTMVGDEDLHRPGMTILPTLLRPKSKGKITLASGDIKDYPVIDPNYLADEHDVKTLVEGFKIVVRMAESSAFKKSQIKYVD